MLIAKPDLRKTYKTLTANTPKSYRSQAAKQAAELFKNSAWLQDFQNIACYLPTKIEFDALPLIATIWQANKQCYLPVLAPNSKIMQFFPYHDGDALQANQFGILEPKTKASPLSGENLDLVVMPLIAFDTQGHRLGTGGGFYDHTFAHLQKKHDHKTALIGLGYAFQEFKKGLPADPWDLLMQAVITEKTIISCAGLG